MGGSIMEAVAKIFKNGNSQAVRLPKEFRFDSDEIFVRRDGESIVLYPKPKMTWRDFFTNHGACPEFELEREENTLPQERDFFK